MKKIFTFLVAFLAIAGNAVWGQTPITINTAEELREFAKKVNDNADNNANWDVVLGADINLGGEENPWTPIDNFKGTFDGGNHTISGLYIENATDYAGLFGKVEDGSIKNLTIQGEIKDCTGNVGGFCGYGYTTTLINCHNEVDFTVNGFSQVYNDAYIIQVGGVAGYSKTLENCSNKGSITINIPELDNNTLLTIGGIGGSSNAKNCYNSGTITINGDNHSISKITIAGVIGSGWNIENCYNTGDVAVKELSFGNTSQYFGFYVGGIVGEPMYGSIHYCYNIGNLSIPDELSSSEFAAIGSIAGYITSTTVSDSYYLEQENIKAIGFGTNTGKNVESKDETAFESGEVAWLLREGSFGQSLNANGEYQNDESSPVLLAFDENKGKEVYKLTLSAEENSGITIDEDESTIYRNAIESNLLSETKYNSITKETGEDIVWKDEAEKVVVSGNKYTPTEDIELTATINKVYNIKTIVTPEGAGDITVKESAAAGETISFTVMANEGYEFISVEGATFEEGEEAGSYTFTMPAEDITITATFKATETGGDDDDEGEGGIGTKRYQLFLADQDFYLNDEYDAEGLVLYSLHDKRYTKAGSSFTIWFEKHGEVNEGARVFISNRANGEYKEVKLDEVSGYYQIRNVQSNIYVKLYTEEGFPVANESIEATDARAYAQANKIVVITPEPTDVQIISMAGAVVATAQVAGQQEFANLAEGVYIVRMGKEIVKLQVRN